MNIAFYINCYNDVELISMAVFNIRKHYKKEKIFIYDDYGKQQEALEKLNYFDFDVVFLPRRKKKMGWAGYYTTLNELENFIEIFENNEIDYLVKMDTDTLICNSNHEDLLKFGGDIVGKTNYKGTPGENICAIFSDDKHNSFRVLGGCYFVKNNIELLKEMYKKFLSKKYFSNFGLTGFHEDEAIPILCEICGGYIRYATELRDIHFLRENVIKTKISDQFAIHPVKDLKQYSLLKIKKTKAKENNKKELIFYMNVCSKDKIIEKSIESIRKHFPKNKIYVYADDIEFHYRDVNVLQRKNKKMGWESVYLVKYELENFIEIFDKNKKCQYIFKMDPDTIVCDSNYLDMLNGSDIIANRQKYDETCFLNRLFGEILNKESFLGGGYFIKNNDTVRKMLKLWNELYFLNVFGQMCPEDQTIASLCHLVGGTITGSKRLNIGYNKDVDIVRDTDFAIHPIKDIEKYEQLFGSKEIFQLGQGKRRNR